MQKKEENTMTMLKLSDIEKVTGGVLDDDYIDYLTRVMFYAKRKLWIRFFPICVIAVVRRKHWIT